MRQAGVVVVGFRSFRRGCERGTAFPGVPKTPSTYLYKESNNKAGDFVS
jgi:hypothetical protein